VLEFIAAAKVPWNEDAETVRAGLRWGREKERLLAWVESQMLLRLTIAERRSIELYYFRGLNYREAARVLEVNPTSVYRAARRGILKLREAAKENPPEAAKKRRKCGGVSRGRQRNAGRR